MKTLEEIKACKKLEINMVNESGGCGRIHIGIWEGFVIWSFGGGWDHVSVHPFKKRIMPSWSDMCNIKDMFFRDDEAVIQIHPVKSEYVNNVSNCLHLWRYQDEFPLPPSWMVGIKDGESIGQVYAEALNTLIREDNA